MSGKGDTPRPMFVTRTQYRENYDRIFGRSTGRSFATCGHEITSLEPDTMAVTLARLGNDGARVVSYETACPACIEKQEQAGSRLYTANDEAAWLGGAEYYNPW